MRIMLDAPIYDQAGHVEIEVRDEVGGCTIGPAARRSPKPLTVGWSLKISDSRTVTGN